MVEKREKRSSIMINRAPVLTLWAAVVAERLGFEYDEALTLGRAVAGLNAYPKGVAQNKIKQMEQPLKSGCYPSNGVGQTNAEKERLKIWLRNYLLGD